MPVHTGKKIDASIHLPEFQIYNAGGIWLNKRSFICLSALILVFLATFLIFTEQRKGDSSGFENISVQEAKGMVEKEHGVQHQFIWEMLQLI